MRSCNGGWFGTCSCVGMLRDFHAFQIGKKIHLACKSLRVSRLLRDQLLRASSSIALNTAEGSGKRTAPDQRRFYGMALGSLRECEAILELEQIDDPDLLKSIDQLGAILYTLTRDPVLKRSSSENKDRTATATATETDSVQIPNFPPKK